MYFIIDIASEKMAEEECVVTAEMGKVLRLSRILGIAPVHITPARITIEHTTSTVNCYQVSASRKYGIISSFSLFLFWLTGFLTNLYVSSAMDEEKAIRFRTGLSLLLLAAHHIFHGVIMLFIAFRGLHKVKQIVSYLNKIQKLNQALKNGYLNLKIQKCNKIIYGYFLSIYIIGLIFIFQRTFDIILGQKSVAVLLVQLSYFLTFSLHTLLQLQFAFVIYLLNATIRVFNGRLQYWNSKWDFEYNNPIVSNREHINFERLCHIYVSICNLITKINKQESVFILILLCFKIIDLFDSLYLIVSSLAMFTKEPDIIMPFSIADFTIEVLWFVYRGATLALLIEPCNQTDKELQALKLRASHVICATNNKYNREKLFTFCRQLIFGVPVFSPLGICSLRRDGLVTVMSVLFTFLVIITQFRLRDGIRY